MLNIVIPMAGAGSRFAQAGYDKPKPFIDVVGHPMIERVLGNRHHGPVHGDCDTGGVTIASRSGATAMGCEHTTWIMSHSFWWPTVGLRRTGWTANVMVLIDMPRHSLYPPRFLTSSAFLCR